ncbi:MAG: restriction endonuclease subunit S, partial [Terriglobia bacterium]
MKYPAYPKYKPSGVEWLGDVPEHWNVKRLKYSAYRADEKVEADSENLVPYIGLEHLESWTGRLLPLDHDLVPTGVSNRFRAGDLLFGKLRPYLAKACDVQFEGLCSSELLVLRAKEEARRYLLYCLLANGFVSLVDASTFGAKMPRASWDFIGACRLPVPTDAEERAIAEFLRTQTAKLDKLVAKKLDLVSKLKEKRTALISRTVTHGLPPEAARLNPHPKLRPSGNEWLGDIPVHWKVKRLKFVSSEITVGIVVEPSKYYEDSGVPCLRSLNVKPHSLTDRDLVYISEQSNEIHRKSMLRRGDLVAVRSGQPGTTAVVDERYHRANCIDLIIIRRPRAASEMFISYFLNSLPAQAQFSEGTGGAIQQHFN